MSAHSLICVLVLTLAGCASTQQPTVIGSAPSAPAVQIAVPVPCVEGGEVEPIPASGMPSRTASESELANAAAAAALRYRELAVRQRDVLIACSKKGVP